MSTRLPIIFCTSFALLLVACGGDDEVDPSSVPSGNSGSPEAVVPAQKAVYENQDRNGSCWDDESCLAGLTCEGASEDVPGKCSFVCSEHSECGNGFLCRSGSCQRDCSDVGEKCSDRRVCCFHDEDGDNSNDVSCKEDEAGSLRCLVE